MALPTPSPQLPALPGHQLLQVSGPRWGVSTGHTNAGMSVFPSKVVTEAAQHLPLEALGAGGFRSKLAKRC